MECGLCLVGVSIFGYRPFCSWMDSSKHAAFVTMAGVTADDSTEVMAVKIGQLLIVKHFLVRTEHRPLAPVTDEKAPESDNVPQVPLHLRGIR